MRELTKKQIKMVHKTADDLPKNDFVKRYGKDGDSVRFATATNMVKKKLGIAENLIKGEINEMTYKDKFNATMKDFGINSLGDLKSDEEKKKFFKAVDAKHDAKNEEKEPYHPGTEGGMGEMMKKEMMKKIEMLKAETDPEKMEMMKKEMMKEMDGMPTEMKKEMMKKMEMAMNNEGFASDAQRKAAFASGYKEKGKDKKEMMKMNAMKMPIRAMYKKEMKTGDDDMSPMNNMKLNAMIKDPHKSKEENPKRDMNAGYMKSDVRADVKNGGGADMSKVKDAPKMQTAMKKINAMYKTEKYHDTKPGSIQDVVAQMYQTEDKEVTVEDKKLDDMIKAYLTKGGTITKLPPALQKGAKPTAMKKHKVGDKGVIKSMKMKEVREFISTYNLHFLTNYKAEEFILKD